MCSFLFYFQIPGHEHLYSFQLLVLMFLNLYDLETFSYFRWVHFLCFSCLRHLKVMYSDEQTFFILLLVIPREKATWKCKCWMVSHKTAYLLKKKKKKLTWLKVSREWLKKQLHIQHFSLLLTMCVYVTGTCLRQTKWNPQRCFKVLFCLSPERWRYIPVKIHEQSSSSELVVKTHMKPLTIWSTSKVYVYKRMIQKIHNISVYLMYL